IPALVAIGSRYSITPCVRTLPADRTKTGDVEDMKNRNVSRIALNGTPVVVAHPAVPRKVAKAPPPAVVYKWIRNWRHVDIGRAPSDTNNRATRNRILKAAAKSAILTFTYH